MEIAVHHRNHRFVSVKGIDQSLSLIHIYTIGGVVFAKILNLFTKNKINPMVGAAGISAFPMSSRVIQKMGLKEDPTNHLLMHAVGANVSGQIGSVVAGGIILSLVSGML